MQLETISFDILSLFQQETSNSPTSLIMHCVADEASAAISLPNGFEQMKRYCNSHQQLIENF